jgi:hypothetical protein
MSCGGCSGKGCCSSGSSEVEPDEVKIKHDSLFITFKVFPLSSNVAMFSVSN